MTTGRINQVTILNTLSAPGGRRSGPDPANGTEVVINRQGRSKPQRPPRPTPSDSAPVRGSCRPTGHPIAPTEFPQGWSVSELARPVTGDDETATYNPREEDTGDRSRRKRRLPASAYPQTS